MDAAVARRESVGWATLLALEALTPQQRAVLVLRQVAELGADDVADVLGTTAEAVRATHTRARRALRDASPREPSDLDAVTFAALQRLGAAIASGDLAGLQSVLTSDVRLVSDSAGQYQSAVRELRGPEHVARFLLGVNEKFGPYETALVRVNDRWALASRPTRPGDRSAPRSLTVFTFAPDGRIDRISMVMADRKLRSVAP